MNTCPNCGYCPHCGRKSVQPFPFTQPYIGTPFYPQPTITWGGGQWIGNTGGLQGYAGIPVQNTQGAN